MQELVVLVPVSLNVRGKIKQGLAQPFPLDQEERDQESSDSAVAVEEWMNRLKLLMHQRAGNEVR